MQRKSHIKRLKAGLGFIFTGNRFNSVHGCLLIACAWVYALLFAASPLADWGKYGPEPYGTACCIDWRLSNRHATARSYTVALFIFCYILPCCIIVTSYSGILVTVNSSRKHTERHSSRQTHMTSIQTIIVKVRGHKYTTQVQFLLKDALKGYLLLKCIL